MESKRIDIRIFPNKVIRGMASIRPDGGVTITYKKVSYNSPEELKRDIDFKEIVCGDPIYVDALLKSGYPARNVIKIRESLHVTIPTQILEKIQQEAFDSQRTTSAVVERILREYYGLN